MVLNFELTYVKNGGSEIMLSPQWDDIEKTLTKFKGQSGELHLEIVNCNDEGPERLSVESDGIHYMVSLLEYKNGDADVRTLNTSNETSQMIMFNGEYWPEEQLTADFNVVIKTFRELYFKGDVDRKVLD